MEQSKQVCSRELAEKMKVLGFVQESEYCWCADLGEITISCKPFEKAKCGEHLSLYSVYELGCMLKQVLEELSGKYINNPRGELKRYWHKITKFEDEADNRAEMLIYLAEQNLINPKNINL